MNLAYHPTHLRELSPPDDPRAHFCYCCWGKRMQQATHWDVCFDPQIPCCGDCAGDPNRTCRMPIGALRGIQ